MKSKPTNSTPSPLEDSRLKAAIAGQYRISIATSFEEAWDKLSGFKRSFWLAFFILTLISGFLNAVSALIQIYILPVISQATSILLYLPNMIFYNIS